MKKLVKVEEVEGEGLVALMGKVVTLYCANYIYSGKLIGVNENFVKLADALIVYDTGSHESPDWANVGKFPKGDWYIRLGAVESYGLFKKAE